MRRWFGKVALLLVGLWVVVGVAVISGAAQGASVPAVNIVLLVVPIVAFAPAAWFAIRLHRTDDPERISQLWPWALGLAILGMVIFLGGVYGLYQAEQS
jgi:uncharacterized membrane protein YgdD (TMEM256/DUF423 family)